MSHEVNTLEMERLKSQRNKKIMNIKQKNQKILLQCLEIERSEEKNVHQC